MSVHLLRRDERAFTLVEMLTVIVLLGIIGAGTTAAVIATARSNTYQDNLQEVIDDGRLSMARVREELRAARRVFPTSCQPSPATCAPTGSLHFWIDQNQDNLPQDPELICYVTDLKDPAIPGQFVLRRYDRATAGCGTTPPAGVTATTIAETLVDDQPFKVLDPVPDNDPRVQPTRRVELQFDLLVLGGNGLGSITVEGTVRLRNVD